MIITALYWQFYKHYLPFGPLDIGRLRRCGISSDRFINSQFVFLSTVEHGNLKSNEKKGTLLFSARKRLGSRFARSKLYHSYEKVHRLIQIRL